MRLALPYRKMRWLIAWWLTLSTILNLVDRQTLAILAPVLREEFHLSVTAYSNVVTAFLVAYSVMYSAGGKLVDWIGERVGMALCIFWWSLWTMLTALAQGAWSLGLTRFFLGLGEPGNYPAALRATARWFPRAERGLPIALFSSGSAVGSIIAPPLIAGITVFLGWRAAFVITGALGMLWLAGWWAMYRTPATYPAITSAELAQLERDDSKLRGATPWLGLLKKRNVLALVLSRFVSDPVWYFYLFWIPEYLKRERGFSLNEIGLYAWMPYVAGAIGGMAGGRASDMLIARGVPAATARARVLYISSAIAPLGMLTSQVHSAAMAIFLIGIMAFVVYSWFINTAAMIPDVVPENVVGSVLGFMGTAGSAAGALFTTLVGFLLSHYSYRVVFVMVGSMHVAGALILWSLFRERFAKRS